jgi:hypothetical protein
MKGRSYAYFFINIINELQIMKKLFSFIFVLSLAMYSLPALAVAKPAAPTNLNAAAVSSSQINLTWTDNASNETNFYIERATTSPTTYVQIATVGANVTSYSNTNGAPNTKYYYRVRAHNSGGNSAYSNVANATTYDVAPAAPTSLYISNIGTSSLKLNWTDNSNNETAFYIYRSIDGTNFSYLNSVASNTVIFFDSGLSYGTTYYYKVLAHNAIGDSAYSNAASATTLSSPAAPSNLTVGTITTSSIAISWTDNSNNETAFYIYRSIDGTNFSYLSSVASNTVNFTNSGLSGGVTYYYKVLAHNAIGDSAFSSVASATTILLSPIAPSNLASMFISSSTGLILLTWTDNSNNETGFEVERSVNDESNYVLLYTTGTNTTYYTDYAITSGNTYYYRVRAKNLAGFSAYTNTTSSTY